MANGFFLGGVAEGIESGRKQALGRDELGLRERALEQEAAFNERRLGLQERGLDLRQKVIEGEQARATMAQVTKNIADTIDIAKTTIDGLRAQGKTPEEIARAVQPIAESAKSLARKAGADESVIDMRLNALMAAPTPEEEAVAGARAKVAAAREVSEETGIPEQQTLQAQGVVAAPKTQSTMETIRAKLAAGQPLTPGESRVYQDALNSDPLARLLLMANPELAGPNAPPPAGPQFPQQSQLPTFATQAEAEAAFNAGQIQANDRIVIGGEEVTVNP